MTSQHQEENSDPTEILEELQEFPYLNELITSILYRLRLSSAIELEKGIKLDVQRQAMEQLENRNGELEDELTRMRTGVDLMKEENKLLRETNQKIEEELLKKFQEKRDSVEEIDLKEDK